MLNPNRPIWLAAGVRTPFGRVDGPVSGPDAVALSALLVRHMIGQLEDGRPDLCVWGEVAPNLAWSNIAREVMVDAGADPTAPAFSTIMACATSMVGVYEAAGMLNAPGRDLALVGGVESMSHVQIGLGQGLSDWIRRFQAQRTFGAHLGHLRSLKPSDLKLFIPRVANRSTGMSMGEHTEITAKDWAISREAQDAIALQSHQRAVAAWDRGFFDDLVIAVDGQAKDGLPRRDTSLERLARLAPAFDRTSGRGTLTAGNSTPLTDGAAAIWVAADAGLARLPPGTPRVRLIDWELASVDLRTEGLLMAPAYAIPRLLGRHGLAYGDIALWEIHEAFAAQVLAHIKALQDTRFLRERVGVENTFGAFPEERMNPNGGSLALGHPFGATGARILSQAVKELAVEASGAYAIVSICADGGQGGVALLQNP